MINQHESLLELSMKAVTAAGNILLAHADDVFRRVLHKPDSLRDIATEIDQYAEQEIIKILRASQPQSLIIAEESGISGIRSRKSESNYWLIDPLDGTVNYVNRLPWYAVSIAWVEAGQPVVGAVYLPALGELYYGASGLGAFRNQSAIKINDQKPEEGLFAVTFAGQGYGGERDREFSTFGSVNDKTRGCLRTGSAAINLVYLADGRLGGCFGRANKFWDVAGGLAIAGAAGARTDFSIVDSDRHLVSYLAAVPASYDFLKQELG